jgi:predicted Fe-Mo cluster-binding NifX family protein
MNRKILITIWHDNIAPRFDLASEVLVATINERGAVENRRTLVLPSISAEDLCQLILSEGIDIVICGGIEKEFFQYLNWKKVKVLDSVIGPFEKALDRVRADELEQGAILFEKVSTE